MSKCQCRIPVEHLVKKGAFARAYCKSCSGHVRVSSASFSFDMIDWDEERFPAGAPYAGKTFKEVAALNPAFVKWYADATNNRVQREIARRAVQELTLW